MTDPISDMIIRIKNALLARRKEVRIPHSKIKQAVAEILVENNYVASYKVEKETPQDVIVVILSYENKWPKITGVKRISKPGRRLYTPVGRIPTTLNGYGITILSTSKGLMTDKQARQENVGGEILCQIW